MAKKLNLRANEFVIDSYGECKLVDRGWTYEAVHIDETGRVDRSVVFDEDDAELQLRLLNDASERAYFMRNGLHDPELLVDHQLATLIERVIDGEYSMDYEA